MRPMWLALGVLTAGLLAPGTVEAGGPLVWFQQVAEGPDGPRGEPFQQVLRSKAELERAGFSGRVEKEVAGAVDFAEWMLLAVSMGRCRGRDHAIEVTAVERRALPEAGAGNELVVTVRTVAPGGKASGAVVVTAPYQVVKLRRSQEPVRFVVLEPVQADEGRSAPAPAMVAESWEIGPVIKGKNYSLNMPLRPTQAEDRTWHLDLGPDSGPHYVTYPHGPLTGKTVLRVRFRIEGPPGARVWGKACPDQPSSLTLFFMTTEPDWRGDGDRWWATFATHRPLELGEEVEVVAPLDGAWTSVQTMTRATDPRRFEDALANAERVGFTFGDCESFGHGARATATVRFRVLDFRVE